MITDHVGRDFVAEVAAAEQALPAIKDLVGPQTFVLQVEDLVALRRLSERRSAHGDWVARLTVAGLWSTEGMTDLGRVALASVLLRLGGDP